MKHILLWLSMAGLLGSCIIGGNTGYVEFDVEDVSREQVFIDSITGTHYNPLGGHIALEVSMEGELDSSAEVSFWYYPGNQYGATFNFRKNNLRQKKDGKIPYFKTRFDFYGDSLLIRYIPKGATKGHLKIRTNIL